MIINQDILKWCEEYQGPPAHALLTDPPYHLTSIVKRASKGEPPHTKTYRDMANRATPHARQLAGFMNQTWDGGDIAFRPQTWEALKRHLYPGAFGMAFASSRGWHNMATAIEGKVGIPLSEISSMADLLLLARETKDWDIVEQVEQWLRGYTKLAEAIEGGGFIIHPVIMVYAFGSGFPKSTRIDVQIDRQVGTKGEIVEHSEANRKRVMNFGMTQGGALEYKPATKEAVTWQGHRYGLQSLKPALEPIIVFQNPYRGRPVDNIVETGAGSLWIDGVRIRTGENLERISGGSDNAVGEWGFKANHTTPQKEGGRWPSNLILHHNPGCGEECQPDCPISLLDEQSGNSSSSVRPPTPDNPKDSRGTWQMYPRIEAVERGFQDDGGASRFFYQATWQLDQIEAANPLFYTAKASSKERDIGLQELEDQTRHRVNSGGLENEPRFAPVQSKNPHPTIKSISLTKYLATLLLPPKEYAPRSILIPFAGTGSEMIGATLAGFENVTGIELYPLSNKPIAKDNPNHCGIAEKRLAWWKEWLKYNQDDPKKILQAKEEDERQLRMFE